MGISFALCVIILGEVVDYSSSNLYLVGIREGRYA
jgi:hypothetical protein